MPATIIGEVTTDESTLVLIANGETNEIAFAAKVLQTLTPHFAKSNPPGAMTTPASWVAVVQLAQAFGPYWCPGPQLQLWIAEQVQLRTAALPTELTVAPPAGLTPRHYQIDAAHMIARLPTLLFDEPGTGKTISALLGLVEREAQGKPVLPIVVVSPASVVDPWVAAMQAWVPGWRTIAWRGTPAQRRELPGTADVYVVSYDTARNDAGTGAARENPLLTVKARSLVVDEAHLIKTHTTQRSKAVRRLAKGAHVVGLTGTPITHHPANLWPSLEVLAPGAQPSRERWVKRYCQTVQGDYREEILGLNPAAEPEFRLTLLGQQRRVAKADILTELPPKIYSQRTVELPPAYRKAYDAMEATMLAELPDDGGEISVMGVLAQLTRLSQLACAAADVEVTTEIVEDPATGMPIEKVHQKVTLKAPSWKVDALLEVLEERPGRPVIAAAPSRQLIMLAGQAAEAAGLKVGYVVGGQSSADRTRTIEEFQGGALDLICVTTGAGGVGITLTAADTMVFLQRPYSLVESIQMEDRAHRIGSEVHDSIEIIDVIAKSTIDTRIRAILRERAGQLSELVMDPRIVAELLGGAGVRNLRKAS